MGFLIKYTHTHTHCEWVESASFHLFFVFGKVVKSVFGRKGPVLVHADCRNYGNKTGGSQMREATRRAAC